MKVLTIEQMNRLKELGVDVNNASVRVGQMVFYHGDFLYGVDSYNVHLLEDDDDDTSCFEEEYKAFTLQDIIELLPYEIKGYYLAIAKPNGLNNILYISDGILYNTKCDSILQAAYEMLILVIENGYFKTK